ncbi:MAG: trypsin-like peptidase domain-containing protein [Leadbetterella sp.]
MNLSNTWKTVFIALGTSICTLASYKAIVNASSDFTVLEEKEDKGIVKLANFPPTTPGDFTYAASVSAPSVVHIKAKSQQAYRSQGSIFDFFGFDDDMFGNGGGGGQRMQKQESSGSGVIISGDGYIVTNNHVVEGSEELEVITWNKKSYEATIVGTDPSTDIAVIKISETKLPAISFSNSDDVKVGEWVLAVGNPFNLENTVTAGIVSALSRSIDILGQSRSRGNSRGITDSPIESFIQTDAAVNPGNSGGALVNLQGNLIGINTAIASPNGAYAGYAFAVPSSIVKKVSTDLIKFGNVQRGFIGIQPVELDNRKAKEFKTDVEEGIYVQELPDGAAKDAGIRKGDVITKIDGVPIKSEPKFREMIGRKRPGEKVVITVNREGSVKDYTVTLKNNKGGEGIVKKDLESSLGFAALGIDIQDITTEDKEKFGIRNGVKISSIDESGTFSRETNIQEGFVITRIGNAKVNSVKDVKSAINQAKNDGEEYVVVCGIYPERPNKSYCVPVTFGN